MCAEKWTKSRAGGAPLQSEQTHLVCHAGTSASTLSPFLVIPSTPAAVPTGLGCWAGRNAVHRSVHSIFFSLNAFPSLFFTSLLFFSHTASNMNHWTLIPTTAASRCASAPLLLSPLCEPPPPPKQTHLSLFHHSALIHRHWSLQYIHLHWMSPLWFENYLTLTTSTAVHSISGGTVWCRCSDVPCSHIYDVQHQTVCVSSCFFRFHSSLLLLFSIALSCVNLYSLQGIKYEWIQDRILRCVLWCVREESRERDAWLTRAVALLVLVVIYNC